MRAPDVFTHSALIEATTAPLTTASKAWIDQLGTPNSLVITFTSVRDALLNT